MKKVKMRITYYLQDWKLKKGTTTHQITSCTMSQRFIYSDLMKPLNVLLEKRQIAGIAWFIPRASGNSYPKLGS